MDDERQCFPAGGLGATWHDCRAPTAKYSTYLSGKWRTPKICGNSQHNWPRQRGFDRFWEPFTGRAVSSTRIPPVKHLDFALRRSGIQAQGFYYTDAINDHATGFINEHKGMIRSSCILPHGSALAHACLAEDIEKYEEDTTKVGKPLGGPTKDNWRWD